MTAPSTSSPLPLYPVALLATEGVSLSSLNIFREMIRLADGIMAQRRAGLAEYQEHAWQRVGPMSMMTLSVDGKAIRSAYGQMVAVDGGLGDASSLDLLILPSHTGAKAAADIQPLPKRERALPRLIADIWERGTIVAAAGSSVAMLARAGLLDGRAATTSAELRQAFQRRFPLVELDASSQITEDSNIFCADKLGSEIALACRLVSRLTAKWVGETAARLSQPSLAQFEAPQPPAAAGFDLRTDAVVAKAMLWIARNYAQRLDTAELAASLSVSENTLLARFKRAIAVTPHGYMRELRLDAAAGHLRNTNMPVTHIAARVGYTAVDFFKDIFEKRYGLRPADYRRAAHLRAQRQRAAPENMLSQ